MCLLLFLHFFHNFVTKRNASFTTDQKCPLRKEHPYTLLLFWRHYRGTQRRFYYYWTVTTERAIPFGEELTVEQFRGAQRSREVVKRKINCSSYIHINLISIGSSVHKASCVHAGSGEGPYPQGMWCRQPTLMKKKTKKMLTAHCSFPLFIKDRGCSRDLLFARWLLQTKIICYIQCIGFIRIQ